MVRSKIAYCIAAYNAEPFIKDLFNSIAAQTGIDDCERHIFIVDDKSTDHTINEIRNYGQMIDIPNKLGCTLYARAVNSAGVCAIPKNFALNKAMEWGADYIVLMDADDKLRPTFTEVLLTNFLLSQNGPSWVTCVGRQFGGANQMIVPKRDKTFEEMRHDNGIPSWCMIRASAIAQVQGYREVLHEDYDLWIRLLKAGHVYNVIGSELYDYRVHPGQKTAYIDHDLAHKEIIERHFK